MRDREQPQRRDGIDVRRPQEHEPQAVQHDQRCAELERALLADAPRRRPPQHHPVPRDPQPRHDRGDRVLGGAPVGESKRLREVLLNQRRDTQECKDAVQQQEQQIHAAPDRRKDEHALLEQPVRRPGELAAELRGLGPVAARCLPLHASLPTADSAAPDRPDSGPGSLSSLRPMPRACRVPRAHRPSRRRSRGVPERTRGRSGD